MSEMKMTKRELDFFCALMAPFPDADIKTRTQAGRQLSYIRSRTVMNRLDEVCGPNGWTCEYTNMGQEGMKCRLSLYVPTRDGGWAWISKEDGGGRAGMPEEDNDEKSAYSDALKRAGVEWGIARYLYQDGMPRWAVEAHAGGPAKEERPERPERKPPAQSKPAPQQGGANEGAPTAFPRPGKSVWAWIKRACDHYREDFVPWFKARAHDYEIPGRTDEWNQEHINVLLAEFVMEIQARENYDGYFDGIPQSSLGFE